MAYSVGTGATGFDFLDAVRTFASGLGWSVDKWDTDAKLLYISKGVCRICLNFYTFTTNTYQGSTLVPITEGAIRGQLCQSFVSGTDWWNSPGGVVYPSTTGRDNGPVLHVSMMQGPFVQWFLFSNANGDYIHTIIQTTSDMYMHFGFGIADNNGLTHSGAAYAYSEAGRTWFRHLPLSSYPPTSTNIYYNKTGLMGNFFGNSGERYTNGKACIQVYTENALPVGFENNIAHASNYVSLSYSRIKNTVVPLKTINNAFYQSNYPSSAVFAARLIDPIITISKPDYTSYVPMLGLPLILTNSLYTLACAIGSVPDLRVINIEGMSPQQELTIGDDVWKVFPQLRQTAWSDNGLVEAATSGHFGIACKKIL